MKIGYARVSTEDQDLDIQLTALRKAGCKKIFQEKISGTTWERPELHNMLMTISAGDIVVVARLDRLARSTKMLLEITDRIMTSGGKFMSLSEPWADTTSPAGKMIMTFFAGMAEFERDLIRARTGAGRKQALERGVKFGRPSKMTPKQMKLAKRLLKEGQSAREVAATFGVHYTTLYRLLRSDVSLTP
ncbi:MAG: recombinase family protein [Candidatus Obscuribacterales bacterium]